MLTQTVTITQNSTPNIIIGRRSTYETQQVIFDISWLIETYGEGTAELLIKRPKDASAYPVVATLDGNTLTWTVSETDTQDKGHGECEIYWYVNGGLAKSCICGITILRDIGDTTETAPDPYETWVDELARLGAETLANAQAAEQSANNAAQSASEADNSAAAALESEENALNSENAAKASEQAAAASEQGAEQSAMAARQSATEAAQSASAAESSSSDAQSAADNASASADRAEQAAASIEGDTERAETAAREAQGAATSAQGSASVASTKATEAAGSAATAEQAANTATQEAADASASATAAAGSASSASASATAAGNAQSAAETAQGKAEDAQEAAETAAQSIEDSAAQINENTADIADLKSAFETHEQYAEETYAKQDGTYEDLTAGNAYELLSDRGDTNQQPYLFRQTGGDSSAYNREQLKMIVGGTVAWNQLSAPRTTTATINGVIVTPTDGTHVVLSGTSNDSGTLSTHAVVKTVENHVYACISSGTALTQGANLYTNIGGNYTAQRAFIRKETVGRNATCSFRTNTNNTYTDATAYLFTCDLTQMFGSTIADYIYSLEQATAGAGVAFFRSLFLTDYYDYNPGELKSVGGVSAHETVGFNQWDEEWEPGYIGSESGTNLADNTRIRSKNYIRVIPGSMYYAKCPSPLALRYYDENKTFISSANGSGNNSPFTIPTNAHFARFYITGTTYNHDICINLSDPKRNGTYEPYKKRTYPLDDSLTLRGVPKLDSNNRLYYDGDTYEPDGTVTRKYGIVDLGTLSWATMLDTAKGFYTEPIFGTNTIDTARLAEYAPVNGQEIYDGTAPDKTYGFYGGTGGIRLRIKDTQYGTNNNAFKAAMSGVMLVYELATPTTETAEPYRELEICDRDGTEEFVSTGIVPVGHETFYPVNVFDYIDRLTEPDADMIADSAIAANKYFSVGNRLFLSTASIAAGAMIIPGTNCTETSLAAALNALNA